LSLLLEVTGFSDTLLKELILRCFKLLNQGRDPVPYMRTAVQRTSLEKPSTIEAKLSTARAALQKWQRSDPSSLCTPC
jgi:hypothetical protein